MANQPTKYSKFLVGAASAALVASAVAPVASAADFSDIAGNTHAEAIKALSETGVVSGYPDGTFKPNQELTRGNVVKFLGKWLVAQGYEIPADAVSNPRFVDLKTTSEKETLEYAAVVKDNGVFVGSNGNLMASNKMTRQDMAVVIVRALNTVNNIDLETYVAGQTFDRDVKDLNSAYASKKSAIDVFDFFDITNPNVAAFNPNNTTTRGQFVSFLERSINTDFSDVTGAVTATGAVKAINATTVEVTFKDAVENVSGFTIEGLTVSNAVVKQSDNKVVVLTTSVQEGGKEYTLSHAGEKVGTFKGLSDILPKAINFTKSSEQGKLGAQVVLSADVGVKQAGIPVTFNVKADSRLNENQVYEAVTNADGVATFSYTQYSAGTDSVVAYPTGAPTVRDLGYVFWGVDTILTVTAQDEKQGNSVNNGEAKTYKLTYLNPETGKPVANKQFNVTFKENVNVNVNQVSNATVNGKAVRQLLNDTKAEVATVTTDSKGEAIFTVSGTNTVVTPVVFENEVNVANPEKYEASKLQAQVDKVTFGAVQSEYVIDVTREGAEEAALGIKNGREYKVVVKTKDGKVAKNEIVNVAFNEDVDRVISTNTNAYIVKKDENGNLVSAGAKYTVKTDSKGEATFTIASNEAKEDYATPVVWIDINSADAKDGNLDEGEPSKVAPITYFAPAKLSGGVLTPSASFTTGNVEKKEKFDGNKPAYFVFSASNQSGKEIILDNNTYLGINASFTVTNTGSEYITVHYDNKTQLISPNNSYEVNVTGTAGAAGQNPYIWVTTGEKSTDDLTTSVKVLATGNAQPRANTTGVLHLGTHTATADFVATKSVGTEFTGVVNEISVDGLTFAGKNIEKFASSTKFFLGSTPIYTAEKFVEEVLRFGGEVSVTFTKDADGVKTFTIISGKATGTAPINADKVNAKKALEDSINAVSLADYDTAKATAVNAAVSAATTVLNAPTSTTKNYKDAKTTLEATLKTLGAKDALTAASTLVAPATSATGGATADTLTFTFTATEDGTVALPGFAFDSISEFATSKTSTNRATIANSATTGLSLTVTEDKPGTPAVNLANVTTDVFVFDAKVTSTKYLTATFTITVKYNGTAWVATAVKK